MKTASKYLSVFLAILMICAILPFSAFAAEDVITIEDTGPRGEAWPNAYNLGWHYASDFDTSTITSITCGMKDADGELIVEYTASGDQLKYQNENGYITATKQSSAPFYQEYDGTAIPEGADYDWTVTLGEGFCTWQPATFYVTVVAGGETYKASRAYSGAYAEPVEDPHVIVTENDKAATATEDGYTGDKVCKYCGKVFEKGEVIPANGHKCPFNDISQSGYHDWIEKAADAKIVNGYPDGSYRPNAFVTRAQFITMLYRAVGAPEASTELSFKDKGDIADAYKDAVVWGVENEIILGYADGNFMPNQCISRAQMATFMYRYLKNVAEYDFGTISAVTFSDKGDVAADYAEAVNAIVSAGIMNGLTTTLFVPNGTANRGMAATVMYRMYALLNE